MRHKNEFWRSVALPFFEPSPVEEKEGASLEGSLSVSRVGEIMVGQVRFNNQKISSARCRQMTYPTDYILLHALTSGSLVGEYAGNTVSVKTGDIILRDLMRPGESQVTEGSALIAIIPRRLLLASNLVDQLHGTVLHVEAIETRLLTDFLNSLVKRANMISPAAVISTQNAFIDLLLACLYSVDLPETGTKQHLSATLQDQILKFIDQNVTDQNLSVEMLQKKFGISRARLYRIFKPYGGIAKLIRDRRIKAMYQALLDPRLAGHSIEKLAFEFGFSSDKQFRRAFHAQFGVTPGYIRSQYKENRFPRHIDDMFTYFTKIAEQSSSSR